MYLHSTNKIGSFVIFQKNMNILNNIY